MHKIVLLFILAFMSLGMPAQKRTIIVGKTYENGEKLYYQAETDPKYDGGEKTMYKYIQDNIKLSQKLPATNLKQWVVVARFTVDKSGNVINPEIIRKMDPAYDNEILRIVKSMKNWTPATVGGKPVDATTYAHVSFEFLKSAKNK